MLTSEVTRRVRRAAVVPSYGRNPSDLVELTVAGANRRAALERLLGDAPPVDQTAYAAFLRELADTTRGRVTPLNRLRA